MKLSSRASGSAGRIDQTIAMAAKQVLLCCLRFSLANAVAAVMMMMMMMNNLLFSKAQPPPTLWARPHNSKSGVIVT